MLELADKAENLEASKKMLEEALASGKAWNKFVEWITAQGGDRAVLENPKLLPQATLVETVPAPKSGFISAFDAVEVGQTVVLLGGGRTRKGDPIDYGVGLVLHAKVADEVKQGDPLFTIHASDPDSLNEARERILEAIGWQETAVKPPAHIRMIIG